MNTSRTRDRDLAQRWAHDLLSRTDWVILDTETTGLDPRAEVVQIAVVGPDRTSLLNSLVRPTIPIPPDATAIHGISDAMVAAAPGLPQIMPRLGAILFGKLVIAYNAAFDERLLQQSAFRHRLGWPMCQWACAMEQYARFVGQWSDRHQTYTFQKLPRRRGYQGEKHQAVDDCLATLDLIHMMAGVAARR